MKVSMVVYGENYFMHQGERKSGKRKGLGANLEIEHANHSKNIVPIQILNPEELKTEKGKRTPAPQNGIVGILNSMELSTRYSDILDARYCLSPMAKLNAAKDEIEKVERAVYEAAKSFDELRFNGDCVRGIAKDVEAVRGCFEGKLNENEYLTMDGYFLLYGPDAVDRFIDAAVEHESKKEQDPQPQ